MFVGAINQDTRAVVAELAPRWRGQPVWVACSGNLTVERILHQAGVAELHGNDVSLWSCALGSHAAGQPFAVQVQDPELAWLEPWLGPGLPTLATLLLCTSYLDFAGRPEPYYVRMAQAYRRHWARLHTDTLARITKAIGKLRLASFWPGDVLAYLETQVPPDAVVLTFPPTYTSGYERLYRHLDEAFTWQALEYLAATDLTGACDG